jgi:ADP-ribose pyrophosphatase YjhB (NUDIX family)
MKAGVDYVGITTPFFCNDGKGHFLLHKRSLKCRDEHGNWDPGGGQLEFGETPEQSVLREVKEEYGCTGIIQEFLPPHSIFRLQNSTKTHWLALPFFVLVDKDHVKNNDPKKIDEIGWFTLDILPHPLHSGFKKTLKRFKRHFEKYKKV